MFVVYEISYVCMRNRALFFFNYDKNFVKLYGLGCIPTQYPYVMPESAAKKNQSSSKAPRRSTSRRPPTAVRSTSRPPRPKSSSRPGRSSSRPPAMRRSSSRPPAVKTKSRSMTDYVKTAKNLDIPLSKDGRKKTQEQLQRAIRYRQAHR